LHGIHGRLDGGRGRVDLLQCGLSRVLCARFQKPAHDFAAEGMAPPVGFIRDVLE
jgi:hypothetical protein